MLPVQPQPLAHLRHIALGGVALKVCGHVHTDGGFGVLEIRQTNAGNDAVAQCHIGALGVGGGLSGFPGGLLLHGGGSLLRRQSIGLLCKGGYSQQHQRGGAAQPCGKTGMVHK